MKKIAFLGLGIMGEAMASHLIRAGYQVRVWNRTKGKKSEQQLVSLGAISSHTIADAVSNVEVIITCLPDVADVKAVLFGDGGIESHAKKGSLIIDTSTIGPKFAREVYERLSHRHLRFLDAPFTGGDIGGRAGTLTFLVGGDAVSFQEAEPIFACMGKMIKRCGPAGSGQAVKLCNQILCAVNLLGVCEALNLAQAQGVDQSLVLEICTTGAGNSWALSNLGPRIVEQDFSPGFVLDHMINNLRLVLEMKESSEIELPGTELAESIFKSVREKNHERFGTQAMMKYFDSAERKVKSSDQSDQKK